MKRLIAHLIKLYCLSLSGVSLSSACLKEPFLTISRVLLDCNFKTILHVLALVRKCGHFKTILHALVESDLTEFFCMSPYVVLLHLKHCVSKLRVGLCIHMSVPGPSTIVSGVQF